MGVLATTYGAAVAAIKGLIGKANGIAGLGSDGKVPSAQLPSLGGGGTSQDATSLAITAADEGSPAGNTRGDNAVDLQTDRSAADDAATGNNATISGGRNNKASGQYSTVSGGIGNQALASYNVLGGGNTNGASSNYGAVLSGSTNNSQEIYGVVVGGRNNLINGDGQYSTVLGQGAGGTHYAEFAMSSQRFSISGDAQRSVLMWLNDTADASKTELFADGVSERITLLGSSPRGEYLSGRLTVFGRRSNGDYARWTFEDVTASRIGSGNVTVDVGGGGGSATGISPDQHTGTGSTCLVDVDADTSNQALRVQVTGNASEDWRWHAIFDGHRGLYGS